MLGPSNKINCQQNLQAKDEGLLNSNQDKNVLKEEELVCTKKNNNNTGGIKTRIHNIQQGNKTKTDSNNLSNSISIGGKNFCMTKISE